MMEKFTYSEVVSDVSLADLCSGSAFVVFMSLLNACVQTNNNISGFNERVKSVDEPADKYDFVVIGGGAGGAVVASRLSENPHWKVLLLEAGPDAPAGAEIPSFFTEFLNSKHIWNYRTTNESSACLAAGGSCAWPSGRNLGGNTEHNAMIYLRGNPQDYNNWAAMGNEGWTFDEVEPFFIKGENNGEIERVGTEHHGVGGPLSVERFPYMPPMAYAILNASVEAGYSVSEDLNGDNRTGFAIIQSTTKNGVRRSSAASYLRPVRNRKNLHISLMSLATKLIIHEGRAVGVEYYKDGVKKIVHVTREVIVSGGAIESPHLLLLSGIGPKKHLESMNIEVVLDLPGVGENFHDHPTAPIGFRINEPDTFDNNWAVAAEYLANQTGPMSNIGLSQTLGFLSSKFTTSDYPDIEIYFGGHVASCATGEVNALTSTKGRVVSIGPSLLRPKSRGRVTLASNDPFTLPVIWSNEFGESTDVDRMIEGMKMILKLIDTEALSRYNFTFMNAPLKVCSGYEFPSDDYWACAMRQGNFVVYHWAGTCKMGPCSDSMAVVDPRLRVHGITGLRVADASIMPVVTSSNTQAPTMMIGERAAQFIKEDWGVE